MGWAWDPEIPDLNVTVELSADGKPFARVEAGEFREDLLRANIGNGWHAFRVTLPSAFCDGHEHWISARNVDTGNMLSGSPVVFKTLALLEGNVDELQGTALTGWVRHLTKPEESLPVTLLDNGRPVAAAVADQPFEGGGNHRFRIVLPSACLDGLPHLFSVWVMDPPFQVGEISSVAPFMLTPEDVLRRNSGPYLRGYLVPSGQLRYESLRRQLKAIAEDIAKTEAGSPAYAAARINQLVLAHEEVVRGFGENRKAFPVLAFPAVAQPKVSVVIPAHNKFAVTYNCLASLLLAPNGAPFEVIVVDDGSTDHTTEMPALIEGVKYVRNDTAQGFVKACNRGADLARGDYIVMLNNDTEVSAGWIDELLNVFETFEGVGLAGAKLIYPSGALQEAGGIVWSNGQPMNYGRNGNPKEPRYNYVRQVDYISGACIMLPAFLWKELGGFDEDFAPAYFEDTDLAFRVREAGYKTVYTPFAEVVHYEGISSGTSTETGIKRYQLVNQPKFKARWADAYRNNGRVGQQTDLIKDRNVNYRALVIDALTPQPDKDAGSYAAVQEMRILESLGFKLTFVPENLEYRGAYTDALQRMGIECQYAPFTQSVAQLIEERGTEFDVIYITRYYVAAKYIDLIRRAAPQAKIVFNNADLHFLRELRMGISSRSREQIEKAVQTRDAELAVMDKVDLVLSYNEVEHAIILSHNLDATPVSKCPWVVELPSQVPGFAERHNLAFLGGFGHPPNAEAVEWFVEEVMPLLRKKLPGVCFIVYGSNVPESIDALGCEDVIIKGYVEDVAEVYDKCRIFIAPLKTGAGLKGKVAGALAHGVPTVLSPIAAEGLGVTDGREACIAGTVEEWAAAIADLYGNQDSWVAMSAAARNFASRQFSFEAGKKAMRDALEQIEFFAPFDHAVLYPA
jgi:GT2 family glycosyltransferase